MREALSKQCQQNFGVAWILFRNIEYLSRSTVDVPDIGNSNFCKQCKQCGIHCDCEWARRSGVMVGRRPAGSTLTILTVNTETTAILSTPQTASAAVNMYHVLRHCYCQYVCYKQSSTQVRVYGLKYIRLYRGFQITVIR